MVKFLNYRVRLGWTASGIDVRFFSAIIVGVLFAGRCAHAQDLRPSNAPNSVLLSAHTSEKNIWRNSEANRKDRTQHDVETIAADGLGSPYESIFDLKVKACQDKAHAVANGNKKLLGKLLEKCNELK